jgi:hypothetical protein
MEIENAADQTLLKLLWKMAEGREELAFLKPSLKAISEGLE